jgi:hypothetical protein
MAGRVALLRVLLACVFPAFLSRVAHRLRRGGRWSSGPVCSSMPRTELPDGGVLIYSPDIDVQE